MIDDDLKKKNFKFAGETPSGIWTYVSINQHPVVAEHIAPEKLPPFR